MSNLLKYGYFIPKEGSRVIDYNEQVKEKLEKLEEERRKNNLDSEQEEDADGFLPGLNAKELELIMEEQPEETKEEQPDEKELLEDAKTQVEQLLADAREEAEQIRQNAHEEGWQSGYQEGALQANEQLEQQNREYEQKMSALENEYQEKLKTMEPELVNALCDIYEHVFHVNFAAEKDIVLYLIKDAMGNISDSKDFIIRVSGEDFERVRDSREQLFACVPGADNIDVIQDVTLKKNQCMIETEGGVFDCSVDVQLEGLTKALKTLSYK